MNAGAPIDGGRTGDGKTGDGKTGGGKSGGKTVQKFPWQVGLAAFAWAVLGVTALTMALTSGGSRSEADSGSVSQVQGNLGNSAASGGGDAGANPVILVIIGLAALLLTGLLVLGQSWARLALTVLGVGAVIYFAIAGQWEALIAMVVIVVGSVPLLSGPANRYLAG